MEKLNVNPKIAMKSKASKRKPIKIIYFSNPRKVWASPADFRSVVQELTGRDSDVADLSDFPSAEATSNSPAAVHPAPDADRGPDPYGGPWKGPAAASFEMFDEASFPPQLLESFPGFPPTAARYDQLGEAFRDLDAM